MKRVVIGIVLVVAALATFAFWPTHARKLTRAADALLDAVEHKDLDAIAAGLADDFTYRDVIELGTGDRTRALTEFGRLAKEIEKISFTSKETRVDSKTDEVALKLKVFTVLERYGPSQFGFDLRLRFVEGNGKLLLKELRSVQGAVENR